MSHLFEEFSQNDPEYIDLSEIETYEQCRLRELYVSLADKNALAVELFDPNELNAFKRIKLTSGVRHLEKSDPQLTVILRRNMLKSVRLEPPTDLDDPSYILDRPYTSGAHVAIFTVTREDDSVVPVYYENNKDGDVSAIYLMSFDKAQETFLHYRHLDEYRSKLQIDLKIGYRALRNFSLEELKDFSNDFETIQKL